jgi:hypothetical protein
VSTKRIAELTEEITRLEYVEEKLVLREIEAGRSVERRGNAPAEAILQVKVAEKRAVSAPETNAEKRAVSAPERILPANTDLRTLAATSTDFARRAPRHPRTLRSTTAAAMPALSKMDLQRAAA